MTANSSRWLFLLTALWLASPACKKADPVIPPPPSPVNDATTYTNPLLPSGPDPWVYQKDGVYYYMHTTGNNLQLWKTAKMSELGSAPNKIIWSPPAGGSASRDIWAPEIHYLDGKWYVYFTAGPGNCCGGQRTWVLENSAADPTTGTWVEKGRIYNPAQDYWAIDGTVLEQGSKRYFIWSGQSGGTGADKDEQRLYISEMSNPWTLIGPRVELSRPQYNWETSGTPDVNEGPQVLKHNGRTFIVYSASHCSTDDYALGLLSLSGTGNPMDPNAWTKSAAPVFTKDPNNKAFGPGHNSFFVSRDGTESWILYHANPNPGQGCGDARTPRMQKFTWNADGTPNFGAPAPINTPLPEPAGE
ncbi:glycoside hydrolase family 43 protein [Solirubrum puertoriconensis]|uniref:Glycosyl hydrolase family 43 n=1 Tax=Solirubrum puertoriconensis TaxID=1751427 RepID=A0A9X0HM96_SOLP1|nr:glycoside hydrolase family 43 protein [Solirubrum puertoriconensis]KUG08562.1 glycosyl hydrolase family 43 [Solirubrum puertoriconensis]